jgi:hypothetical protein
VAANVKLYIDKVVDREDSLFLGYDISTDKATGVKKPAPGLKPHPGLGTYLFGLQLWVTAMEIESGGTDAGRSRVKQKYSAALRKHVAFLQSMANAGADPNYPQPMQDRIVAAVRCVWNVNGQIGAHPDQHGMCSAHLSCQDDIAHTYPRIPPVSIAWTQAPSMVCQLDPAGQQLSDRSFPPDHLNPVERALQEQYGLLAMDRMADILGRVAAFGTAVHGDSFAGSFGGKSDAPFFVYAVDGSGAVKNYRGYPSKPLPQAATAGTIANIKTLIPGGDKTFYALTKDGKLNWYQFTPARQSAGAQPAATTVSGPVTVASNFSAYKQVFGGSDGVIYAIQNDGTLLWFRHAGFANGGGAATMTGPKPVAPGFGQFKNVFSAGDGIIYAIADDGSLLWYRHKNFLTGVADATNAKSGPIPKEGARKVEQTFVGPSQLEGPINVGSGWGDFRQVIPSGDGVVLAVQTDGKLLWYRHDDYLTGVSSGVPSSNGVQKNAVRPAGWEMQTGAEAGRAVSPGANPAGRESSLASSWGAPAQAAAGNSGSAPVQHAVTGTPQWGTQAQAHAVAGTTVAPSALHESATSLHAGSTSPSATKTASGIGARQNVGSAAVLGVAGGSPHWEGPATIDANSGWQGFAEIAASLPVTVQTNVIK